MRNATRLAAFCIACLVFHTTVAQPYPARPVRLVVGFAPGGSTDVTARIIAERLSATLGQQVIVDNRAGAGGNIGADIVARSHPDGHTVLMATTGVMAFNHYLYAKLPYSAERDLAAVTQIGSLPLILIVPASLPARTVKWLVAAAKARPGKYSFGSSGVGGATHVTAELFKALAALDIVHVPYKGSGQMMADSAETAVRGADIVNIITPSITPVLDGAWLESGQHINAAGANALARKELDLAAVRRCDVIVVDSRSTARKECGDLLPLVEAGLARWDALPEIGEIAAGLRRGRTSDEQTTLYESHGMAVQDLYVAAMVLERARDRGLGSRIAVSG